MNIIFTIKYKKRETHKKTTKKKNKQYMKCPKSSEPHQKRKK